MQHRTFFRNAAMAAGAVPSFRLNSSRTRMMVWAEQGCVQ